MGRLLDGKWIKKDLGTDDQGNYVRRETEFRQTLDDNSLLFPTDSITTEEDDYDATANNASNSKKRKAELLDQHKHQSRYLLLVGSPCGWSHRVLLVRALKGLNKNNTLPVIYTDAFMGEDGWTFYNHNTTRQNGNTNDDDNKIDDGDKKLPAIVVEDENNKNTKKQKKEEGEITGKQECNNGGIMAKELYLDPSSAGYKDDPSKIIVTKLYELYVLAKSDYTGRASVPVLWDRKNGTIVNNESSDLIFMMEEQSNLATATAASNSNNTTITTITYDLVPLYLKQTIQDMIDANYMPINNGVYRCGFASSQEAYTKAATALFERLDELEALLGRQRYLCSLDQITMADICLFPTLYRFDTIYYTHFKCNRKHIYEYPNLWGWTREIYQLPGVAETCNMKDCCKHYYTSHESIHPRRYIPIGPTLDFNKIHRRDEFAYKA